MWSGRPQRAWRKPGLGLLGPPGHCRFPACRTPSLSFPFDFPSLSPPRPQVVKGVYPLWLAPTGPMARKELVPWFPGELGADALLRPQGFEARGSAVAGRPRGRARPGFGAGHRWVLGKAELTGGVWGWRAPPGAGAEIGRGAPQTCPGTPQYFKLPQHGPGAPSRAPAPALPALRLPLPELGRGRRQGFEELALGAGRGESDFLSPRPTRAGRTPPPASPTIAGRLGPRRVLPSAPSDYVSDRIPYAGAD